MFWLFVKLPTKAQKCQIIRNTKSAKVKHDMMVRTLAPPPMAGVNNYIPVVFVIFVASREYKGVGTFDLRTADARLQGFMHTILG